jgi:hypothetical protein
VNASTRPKRGLRLGLVVLLVLATFFTALPWLSCGWNPVKHIVDPTVLGICTFGFAGGPPLPSSYLPGFGGPYWGNLIVGIVYLVAAFYVAFTKRSL